uniref:Uncharacterized protein n=1 Tax=Tanacetum cinerariifolium TaxID=118510 RepID=A0A6L2P1P5_TANCI|nr:hypothetical protein [Tanacetum cinerariifolium]
MFVSIAYQTYYAYATREKASKEKYVRKKVESYTSPKKKTAPTSKGFRLKSLANVAKTNKKKQHATMPKTKGLDVLSEVALPEAEQIKLATKRSKKDFYMSHTSGSSDGVDTQSKVLDEQQQKTFSQDEDDANEETDVTDESEETESDNDGDDLTHPNLSTYQAYDEDEEGEKADDEEVSSDQGEQDEEDDLYRDVNINLERSAAEMTNAQANQDTEDTHVTLTTVPPVVQHQSSSVSSDLVSKFINPSQDTGIDSILNPNIQSETLVNVPVFVAAEIPSSDTTIPQPPILNIQPLQQTPAVSLISGIVDNYLASKMKEAVDVAIQLQTNKLIEEGQAENQEFLNQVDSTMKTIIKEQVQAQVSKIMPKIKKYVTESLKAKVFVRSTNQPQSSYAVAASLSEFELKKILIDKMEENKSINISDIQNNLYNALVESYNSNKDIITSYCDVVTLKRGRDDQDNVKNPPLDQTEGRREGDQFNTGNDDVTPVRETLEDASQWNPPSSPTPDREWHKTKTVDKRPPQPWISQLAQATGTQSLFNEFLATPIDFSAFIINQLKINNLTQEDYFINNDLEYLKGESSSQKYTTSVTKTKATDYGQVKWIEDKVSRLWSPEKVVYDKHAYWGTYHCDLKRQKFYGYASNMETSKDVYSRYKIISITSLKIMKYFGYIHLEEIIVRRQNDLLYKFTEGDFKRLRRQDIEDKNRLMHTDELHKFSDDTLNHVRTALNDIATGIEMDYLPKRKLSKQEKQRARVMNNAIDKKLEDSRLMRNLEKFVGERPYGGDLRLLERTI